MKECSFCGTKIKDESMPCPGCGYTSKPKEEILGDAREIDSQIIEEKSTPTNPPDNRVLPTWIKVVLVLSTIFISPLVGLIGGIMFLSNPSPDYKHFGIKLLVVSIIFLIFSLVTNLFGLMALFFGSLMF